MGRSVLIWLRSAKPIEALKTKIPVFDLNNCVTQKKVIKVVGLTYFLCILLEYFTKYSVMNHYIHQFLMDRISNI